MSGPKQSRYEVSGAAAERLRIQRQKEAEREARRRAEFAERRQRERLENHRSAMLDRLRSIAGQLHSTHGRMDEHCFQDLETNAGQMRDQIVSSVSNSALDLLEQQMDSLVKQIRSTISKMEQDEAKARKDQAVETMRIQLEEMRSRLADIPLDVALMFDPKTHAKIEDSLGLTIDAFADISAVSSHIAKLESALSGFESGFRQWMIMKTRCEQEVARCKATVDAVAEDTCVGLWQAVSVANMRSRLEIVEAHMENGDFASASELCKEIAILADGAVAEANAEQLKADQRDYVSGSIAGVLESMGFVVQSSLENATRPDTSVILSAVNAAGQSVAVSVPVEGDVFYDVDGYPMRTELTVDGNIAPTCDEAQEAIETIHVQLLQHFDVKMGELVWEGKVDPDRLLRTADELPSNLGGKRGDYA